MRNALNLRAEPAVCLSGRDCRTVLTGCGLLPGGETRAVLMDNSAKGGDFWERKRICAVPPARTRALPSHLHSSVPEPLSHASVRMAPWACAVARGTSRTYGIQGRAGGPGAHTGQPQVSALVSITRFHTHGNPPRAKEKQLQVLKSRCEAQLPPRPCSQGSDCTNCPSSSQFQNPRPGLFATLSGEEDKNLRHTNACVSAFLQTDFHSHGSSISQASAPWLSWAAQKVKVFSLSRLRTPWRAS